MTPCAADRPRVLVVEDDPSMRLFIAMALETFEIELVECAGVAQALQALQQGPAQLVLCDLNLPGECGLSFIERLAGDAALGGGARVVCFSGGIDDKVSARLAQAKVWRVLAKPCRLSMLEDCVSAALADIAPRVLCGDDPSRHVIDNHFEGDESLYRIYLAACLAQFPRDLQAGEDAAQRGDLPALRRLGHSLKTVLATLGHEVLAIPARDLELQSAQGDMQAARTHWQELADGLAALVEQGEHATTTTPSCGP